MIHSHASVEDCARSIVTRYFGSLWSVQRMAKGERRGLLMLLRDDDPGGRLVGSRRGHDPRGPQVEWEAEHRGQRRSDGIPYTLPVDPLWLKQAICSLLDIDGVDRRDIHS